MKIYIEFCIKWNYGPEFDRVSNIIASIDSNIEVIGNPSPPRSGAFEVKKDGMLVFSKFETGSFPNEKQIRTWLIN